MAWHNQGHVRQSYVHRPHTFEQTGAPYRGNALRRAGDIDRKAGRANAGGGG